MKFQTTDGVWIDYLDQGKGNPVILVTGFGGYKEIWVLQVQYLLKMGYRVITYDHRNQGGSQRNVFPQSMNRLILDLRELVQKLNIHAPLLIGHSMGASVCYGYIDQFSDVAGVIGVDQTPKMLNTKDWSFGFLNANENNYQEVSKISPEVHETLNGLDQRVIGELFNAKNKNPFRREANYQLLLDHFRKDWRETLANTTVPVMLMSAVQSPYYKAAFVDEVSGTNSCVSGVKLNNCGHVIMAEVPDEFNQLLRHFLLKNHRRQVISKDLCQNNIRD
ncbi:alpha/beta hydrolase [Pediococcus inopinatus]|uniref:Alpha/beta hydrolase n=1 Tax=Pediococcus inopinatus TaxID=114090 RepID=A0ABZ0Q6F4_9LACO|nr:alpha/beta hydrolase [Pediococcus inopinatus]WPC18947.1 alpha/beta hydrolase [Pediococcus inopinatus]WPC22566.1 alpha/beta hydrolase [Pediococcus inopinatus]WPP08451.1 alpha/beta hydrolase [Pediococcus inopinatus]